MVHLYPRTTWSLVGTLIAIALLVGAVALDYAAAGHNLPAAIYGAVTLATLLTAAFVLAA